MRLEKTSLDENWGTRARLRRAILQLEAERGRQVQYVERLALQMAGQLKSAIRDAQRPSQAWAGINGQYVYPTGNVTTYNPTLSTNIDRAMGAIAMLDETLELLQEVYNGKIPPAPERRRSDVR